jgi:hypothetical protein
MLQEVTTLLLETALVLLPVLALLCLIPRLIWEMHSSLKNLFLHIRQAKTGSAKVISRLTPLSPPLPPSNYIFLEIP